jgi:hypothetical protein
MPDTINYMILGYVITVLILFSMVAYLVLKARHLRAEYKMLESLEEEDRAERESAAPASSPSRQQNVASRKAN